VVATVLPAELTERFDVVLTDVGAEPSALLYESRLGADRTPAQHATWQRTVPVAGRRWAVQVTDRRGWLAAREAGWIELGIGGLMSTLAAALAYAFSAVLRLRRQVKAARRLGQYTLVEKLGEGGMGTVYRAHHALLRRPTAIKLLDPARSSPAAIARFESEVQLTSALAHPNTVTVYDYGHSPEGVFYYAMEYIDGITLQELVDADGPQPPGRVVAIVVQICAALAEAHAIGLVHRDVKPANVMLCNRAGVADFVKVFDFGLVKDLTSGQSRELSQQAVLIGTPLYVAPEVALRTERIDARADIYALGAVAYFLLTGTAVFGGTTAIEVCMKHVTEPPEPPSSRLGQKVDPALEALVMKCLAKEPSDRPVSAQELARALDALDLPAWTQSDAEAWWEVRGESFTEIRRAARIGTLRPPVDRTLEVDRGRRTPLDSGRDLAHSH
jgi:serine/threonine-protein kinase